jgi:predicted ATPase
MIYLDSFRFPTWKEEDFFIADACERKIDLGEKKSDYYFDHFYPFRVLSENDFNEVSFMPITFIYGSNGTGKSTALNVISDVLKVKRKTDYNKTVWSEHYAKMCSYRANKDWTSKLANITTVMTSDDVFDSILLSRQNINDRIEQSLELKRMYVYNKKQSAKKYFTEKLGKLGREYSNGENGMMYLAEKILEPGLYLLDEPENSLSSEYQYNLAELINFSANRCKAQFIIATHSPFLLSIPHAKIYDLDSNPSKEKNWWELDNMKRYFDLFKKYSNYFEVNTPNE